MSFFALSLYSSFYLTSDFHNPILVSVFPAVHVGLGLSNHITVT